MARRGPTQPRDYKNKQAVISTTVVTRHGAREYKTALLPRHRALPSFSKTNPLSMSAAIGYAAKSAKAKLAPFHFERRKPGAHDVVIHIEYCGVCHSDVHQVRNDWKNSLYPCVPGHEIVGRVTAVGTHVTKHKVGDLVGVGCMVDSCQHCASCAEGEEQYCENGMLGTYNGPFKPDGSNTYGGYSDHLVVTENFVLRVPASLGNKLKGVAPLLCAGVTTYSPLKHWKVGPGQKVAVVGLGGLGHVAVKLAVAMGAEVTVITSSLDKKDRAREIGAHDVIYSKNPADMLKYAEKFDFILSTIPVKHDVNPYVELLKRDGHLVLVGALEQLASGTNNMLVASKRRSVAGSLIGSIAETQEVLDFCGKHGITSDVELIDIQNINQAFDDVEKGKVPYRFVIDMTTLAAMKK